jgi:hypothetical protein
MPETHPQKLCPFHCEVKLLKEHPGNVSARTSEAFDITTSEWVEIDSNHHDWARTSYRDCSSQVCFRSAGHRDVDTTIGAPSCLAIPDLLRPEILVAMKGKEKGPRPPRPL